MKRPARLFCYSEHYLQRSCLDADLHSSQGNRLPNELRCYPLLVQVASRRITRWIRMRAKLTGYI